MASNKIFVYEHPNFTGLSREFTENVPDLQDFNFNDCISSVKVIGQPWVLYEHTHYRGEHFFYEEGEYPSVEWQDAISSMQQVKEDLKNSANKIFVYEHANFTGLSREFTGNVPDLKDVSFNDCISSVKVIGQPWVLYEHTHYRGEHFFYEEGEYPSVEWHDAISSMEKVKEDLTNPQITLYEDSHYGGKSITLNCETNLCFGSFNDQTSSCKVDRGAWVLYQHEHRGGGSIVARAGRPCPTVGWIDNQVSWARPLKPGRPKITAKLLWDKKEENTKSVVIDSICGLNRGKHEQTFSSELSREYEGSVTESFNFSNATQISVGMSFGFDIGLVKSEVNVSLSNTFTVEKGSSNTKTEKKGVKISLPATIRPHTKLTVNVVRKEVDVKVPVKITIKSGYSYSTEYGEYRCQAGNSILAEYQEEDI